MKIRIDHLHLQPSPTTHAQQLPPQFDLLFPEQPQFEVVGHPAVLVPVFLGGSALSLQHHEIERIIPKVKVRRKAIVNMILINKTLITSPSVTDSEVFQ
jgi:hypothetical protein